MFPFAVLNPLPDPAAADPLRPWTVWSNDWLFYPCIVIVGCDCPIHFSSFSPFCSYFVQSFPVYVEEQRPASAWLITVAKTTDFFHVLLSTVFSLL